MKIGNSRLKGGSKLAGRLNIFNVCNSNTVTDIVRLSGSQFQFPRAIMDARIFEFSVTYQF